MRVSTDCPPSPDTPTPEQQRRSRRLIVLRRRATSLLILASMSLQQACYNYVPVANQPEIPQGLVIIKINERGRILVGPKLGTLVDKVEGRIVRMDSVNVEVAVSIAEDVRGSFARWGGDRFVIPREGMSSIEIKKLSRFRTFLTAAGVVAGIVLGIGLITRSKYGGEDPGEGPGNPI